MTDPNSPPRIRDIAPEQATLLHQIHHLAARVARLRQAVSVTTPGSAASTGLLDEIGEVERARELTEIGARANGMPASWVNQARAAGQSGRAWTEELLLPAAPSPTGRRNTKRVVEDTRQLADMAAVTVVRRRRLATDGITTDPEPAAAEQFRRNMAALWTRVSATATSVGMGRHRRGRVFNAASVEIDRRVETYRHYSLDDLNAAWRTYTTPTIAASVRRSLKSLRSAERGTDPPAADPETEQPPRRKH